MTALIGGLVAFWHRVPVIHLEAGLRTRDIDRPFPEEVNPAMLARFSSLHLAPTEAARQHLLDERVPAGDIVVTGNTIVDGLRHLLDSGLAPAPAWIDRTRPVVVTTIHRRENWGGGVAGVVTALTALASERPGTQIVVVTHPNPELSESIRRRLDGVAGVRIVPTLPYDRMLGLMSTAKRRHHRLRRAAGGGGDDGHPDRRHARGDGATRGPDSRVRAPGRYGPRRSWRAPGSSRTRCCRRTASHRSGTDVRGPGRRPRWPISSVSRVGPWRWSHFWRTRGSASRMIG